MFLKTHQGRILHSRGLSKKSQCGWHGFLWSCHWWSGSKLTKTWRSHTQGKDLTQHYQLWWIDRLVLADIDLLRGESQNRLQSENKLLTWKA